MHELSLAEHLLALVLDNARQNGAKRINQVVLELGSLAAVELDSFRTAFELLCQQDLLQDVQLTIHTVQAQGRCVACGCEQPMTGQYAECSICHQGYLLALGGTEMLLKQILIEK